MSKPTHILVPIDKLEELRSLVVDALAQLRFINKCPKVDLSEEGIADRAMAYCMKMGVEEPNHMKNVKQDYSQGAKDLLNTKP